MPVKRKKKPKMKPKKGIKITIQGIRGVKKGKSKVLGCLCEVSSGTKVSYN